MNIVFLIVTYEPQRDEFERHLTRNLTSSSHIIIVDNSVTCESISFVASLASEKVSIIQNFENLGIAEAQNIGISKFLITDKEYLLQLDQDSSIEVESLTILYRYHMQKSRIQKIAGVGPGLKYSHPKSVKMLKSAGMLVHRSAIQDIGFMQRDLFIDLVDYEWCWRAKKLGYSLYSVPCEFFHQLGVNYKIFGIVNISIPSPLRHYYQVRNSLRLIFSCKSPLGWSFTRIPILLVKFISYPIFLPQGKARLFYMALGFFHFVKNKTGRFNR